jgi:hypothetical protein
MERGDKAVTNRKTLEAMASALRVHPTELTGQPWTPHDADDADAHAGLMAIEIALERYELGTEPEVPARAWPQIQADLDRLIKITHWTSDHAVMGELAPAVIGELHGAYLRLPQQRREILLGLMNAYSSAMWTTKRLGGRGLPTLAARSVQHCAEALGDPVWLGYAAWLRGNATGQLDRAAQYRRSVTVAETLTGQLDSGDALQAYGMLHLSAALAASAQAESATAATHLQEASALAARMDTEVGRHLGAPVVRADQRRHLEDQPRAGDRRARPGPGSRQDGAPRAAARRCPPGRVLGRGRPRSGRDEEDPGKRCARPAARRAVGAAIDPYRRVRPRDRGGPAAASATRRRWPRATRPGLAHGSRTDRVILVGVHRWCTKPPFPTPRSFACQENHARRTPNHTLERCGVQSATTGWVR